MPSDQVEQAFYIEDSDGMDDLIRKMHTLESFYREHDRYNGFVPFIKVYREITEDVNALYGQGRFNDPDTMERLDLYFAEQYLRPMRRFIFNDELLAPWKTYLEYCTGEDPYNSLAMFLGINAHINGDLLRAVNHIGLEDDKDYHRINGILENHLSANLHYLILKEHDRLALYAELIKPITWYELHATIIRWREDIWTYRSREPDTTEPLFEEAAETMARRFIDLGHNASLLTLPAKSWRLHRMRVTSLEEIASRLPPV